MNLAMHLAQLGQPTLVVLLGALLATLTLAEVLRQLQGAVRLLVTIPQHVLVRMIPATIEGLESLSYSTVVLTRILTCFTFLVTLSCSSDSVSNCGGSDSGSLFLLSRRSLLIV